MPLYFILKMSQHHLFFLFDLVSYSQFSLSLSLSPKSPLSLVSNLSSEFCNSCLVVPPLRPSFPFQSSPYFFEAQTSLVGLQFLFFPFLDLHFFHLHGPNLSLVQVTNFIETKQDISTRKIYNSLECSRRSKSLLCCLLGL